MTKRKRITCCPHCGSDEGFYILSDYINVRYEHGFDGSERDNTDFAGPRRTALSFTARSCSSGVMS